jgi:hypothetical protein
MVAIEMKDFYWVFQSNSLNLFVFQNYKFEMNYYVFALGIVAISFCEVQRNKRFSEKPDLFRECPKSYSLIFKSDVFIPFINEELKPSCSISFSPTMVHP